MRRSNECSPVVIGNFRYHDLVIPDSALESAARLDREKIAQLVHGCCPQIAVTTVFGYVKVASMTVQNHTERKPIDTGMPHQYTFTEVQAMLLWLYTECSQPDTRRGRAMYRRGMFPNTFEEAYSVIRRYYFTDIVFPDSARSLEELVRGLTS